MLETGLVVPGKNRIKRFPSLDDYLDFFEDVLVRGTASPHQKKIAEMYSGFVRASESPLDIPLLIPEFRYNGREKKHEHRLDFCVIDGATMEKVGFELSPWQTHGLLTGTKGKSQKQINEEAKANFEKEMKKQKRFFNKHGVYALIYTDSDLADPDRVFGDIKEFLEPGEPAKQYAFHIVEDLFK